MSKPKDGLQTFSEYLQALVFAFLMAILIRSFVFEPFKIPSGSMMPTLMVGDHIFVKRFAYGLRIPMTKTWIAEFDEPERGDVVVFTEPVEENDDFIKRVVGLPGDKVAYKKGKLFINDQPATYKEVRFGPRKLDNSCQLQMTSNSQFVLPEEHRPFPHYMQHQGYKKFLETIPGVPGEHLIQRRNVPPGHDDFEVIVPPRHYFVMGDNRDNSSDSRVRGPVPRENLKGKAVKIWLSLNNDGGACPGDGIYGWFGPAVDTVFGWFGVRPFNGRDPSPSVRWGRFWRTIK